MLVKTKQYFALICAYLIRWKENVISSCVAQNRKIFCPHVSLLGQKPQSRDGCDCTLTILSLNHNISIIIADITQVQIQIQYKYKYKYKYDCTLTILSLNHNIRPVYIIADKHKHKHKYKHITGPEAFLGRWNSQRMVH